MRILKRGCMFSKPSPNKQWTSECFHPSTDSTLLGIICPCHLVWCLVAWREGRWTTIWHFCVVHLFFVLPYLILLSSPYGFHFLCRLQCQKSLHLWKLVSKICIFFFTFLGCFLDSNPIHIFNSLWAKEGDPQGISSLFLSPLCFCPLWWREVVSAVWAMHVGYKHQRQTHN